MHSIPNIPEPLSRAICADLIRKLPHPAAMERAGYWFKPAAVQGPEPSRPSMRQNLT